jgi:hypothetical protein
VSADAERTGAHPERAVARYQDLLDSLRVSYDGRAVWRDQQGKQPWKLAERDLFLGRVLGDGHGLQVVATDLSPAMVGFCRQKGLDGHEGPAEDDRHVPPRFFSWRTDEQIKGLATRYFSLVDFHVIEPGQLHFQSLTMRRPG